MKTHPVWVSWLMVGVWGGSLGLWGGPPQLVVERVGSGIQLRWSGLGFLQEAREVSGPWVVVEGAKSPHGVRADQGSSFYRLQAASVLTVSKEGEGVGVVRSVAPGIECGDDCEEALPTGTRVILEAVPSEESVFEGWQGACAGTEGCEVVLDQDQTVGARFGKRPVVSVGFVNGGFEQGSGVGWVQQPGNMIYTAEELQVTPYSGRYAAWVGFHPDNRRSAAIGQQVTLPARGPVYLNFALWLYSEELCDPPWWDTFGTYVDGEALLENAHLCRGNTGGDGWRRISFNLSFLAGRTVWITFEISSVDALASVALIDEVALAPAPW